MRRGDMVTALEERSESKPEFESLLDFEFAQLQKQIEEKTGITGVTLHLDFNWNTNEPTVGISITTLNEIPEEKRKLIESLSNLKLTNNRNSTYRTDVDRYGNIGYNSKVVKQWSTLYDWISGFDMIQSKIKKMASVDYKTDWAVIKVARSSDYPEDFNLFVDFTTNTRQVLIGNAWAEYWNGMKFIRAISRVENPDYMMELGNKNWQARQPKK